MDFWVTRQADRQTSIDKRKDSKKDRQTGLETARRTEWLLVPHLYNQPTRKPLANKQETIQTNRQRDRQGNMQTDREKLEEKSTRYFFEYIVRFQQINLIILNQNFAHRMS